MLPFQVPVPGSRVKSRSNNWTLCLKWRRTCHPWHKSLTNCLQLLDYFPTRTQSSLSFDDTWCIELVRRKGCWETSHNCLDPCTLGRWSKWIEKTMWVIVGVDVKYCLYRGSDGSKHQNKSFSTLNIHIIGWTLHIKLIVPQERPCWLH